MTRLRTSPGASAAVLLAAAFLAGAVLAGLPAGTAFASDGPMATAGASGAPPAAVETAQAPVRQVAAPAPAPAAPSRPLTTAEQIDAFIKGSPAATPSPDEMAALDEGLEPDRRVHGAFEVGVGTHGYRHAQVEAHYPVGKTGHVSVAVGSTRGRGVVGLGCPGPLGPPPGPFDGRGCAPW